MALFKKLKEMTGGVDSGLLRSGVLGRGIIVSAERTRVSTGPDGFEKPVVAFEIEVALDGEDRYNAKARQAIPIELLAQIVPGQSTVAVRVDAADHSRIAIDWETEPPTVTMKQDNSSRSAADILAIGSPCEAVIVQTQPLGMKNPAGIDMHAFLLSVFVDGKAPYQVKIGIPVPEAAVPLLFPGFRAPAKIDPDDPEAVVIDWEAALKSAT